MRKILSCLLLLLAAALPAAGQGIAGIVNWTVTGDSVQAAVSLPGGLGTDLTLSFEDAVGLNLANLGISAQVVNLFNLPLLSRLPVGSLLSGLPVLLRIEPPAAGGLAFSGVVNLELHTHILNYTTGSPLRLYSASLGGPFRDITTAMGSGSYRVRGSSGGFSEFLILIELRPVDQVITSKLNRLEQLLDDYTSSVPAPVYADLEARLATIRADHARGATTEAIQGVDGFLAVVQEHAGTDIPNVWRSARDVQNVAGYLRAGAMTLRFSLAVKKGSGFGF
jgi:hypothetical protein